MHEFKKTSKNYEMPNNPMIMWSVLKKRILNQMFDSVLQNRLSNGFQGGNMRKAIHKVP